MLGHGQLGRERGALCPNGGVEAQHAGPQCTPSHTSTQASTQLTFPNTQGSRAQCDTGINNIHHALLLPQGYNPLQQSISRGGMGRERFCWDKCFRGFVKNGSTGLASERFRFPFSRSALQFSPRSRVSKRFKCGWEASYQINSPLKQSLHSFSGRDHPWLPKLQQLPVPFRSLHTLSTKCETPENASATSAAQKTPDAPKVE